MYEAIEHWKQYKQEQIKKANNKEFDKWMNKLIAKNGITKH
jgi:hypothetical protein